MEGSIAATYTLIYRFLKQQSQNKAAEAVKKAAKAFVVLRDDIEQEGPPLEDIIKKWRTEENTKSGDADSSSEDSESSDSSSDSEDSSSSDGSEDTSGSESEEGDTSSSDSGDDSDEVTKAEKLPKAAERDTSVTLSSAGENALEAAKKVIQMSEKKSANDKNKGSESDSSDSDSSDSGSSSKSSASDNSDAESSSSSPDSSSDSDSSDEDEANMNESAPPHRTKTTEDKSLSTSESSSDSEDESDSGSQQEEAPAAKRRKTSENGAAVTTAVAVGSQQIAGASQGKEKPPPNVRERFQRVKVQNLAPDLLLDNGYEARRGAANDYGERAHRDLVVTRGAGFRKEKNKKKRGSYRGGEITMESHSIKFDF